MSKRYKKALATLLSGAIAISAFGVAGGMSAFADEGAAGSDARQNGDNPEEKQDVVITDQEIESGTSMIGQYDADHVAQQLLVTHTGKSSELPVRDIMNDFKDAQKKENYEDNFLTLSCDEGLYDSLHFEVDQLKANSMEYATNKNYQNPLSGFTFVNPNELLVGSSNRIDHHEMRLHTYNDVVDGNPANLKELIYDYSHDHEKMEDRLDKEVKRAVNDYVEQEDSHMQTHNGIGMDIDGDGLDELIYFSLNYKHGGSYAQIDIYEREPYEPKVDSKGHTEVVQSPYAWVLKRRVENVLSEDDDYISDLIAAESKGYTPLAVGDYNGDGIQELACYLPAKNDDDLSPDACVQVYQFRKDNDSYSVILLSEIDVSSFQTDYGKMGESDGDGIYLPTVALSTTSIRLGEKKDASVGAAQYNTHDDLVITVSVPRYYRKKGLNHNSTTKIFTIEKKDKKTTPVELFTYEYKPFDDNTTRMNFVNTCDADLNGDGFKEIVVAGLKEHHLKMPDKVNDPAYLYGDDDDPFDINHNYVNVITHDGDGYCMVWKNPREVKAPGNLHPEHYLSVEPTALCAGHFMYNTPGLKDQICIQGVILDCTDSKMSGAPSRIENKNTKNEIDYIVDTKPEYDVENFADAGFESAYIYDITLDETVKSSGDNWIDQCVSGRFCNGSDVDQIAIVSSDPSDPNDDNIYMDISIISHYRETTTSDPKWVYRAYNDYLKNENEDDHGTSLFITFMDVEEDTYYYRYAGTYSTYSAPILYAVVQAPPYYRESNEIDASELTISTGVSNHAGLDIGVGVSNETESNVSASFFGSDVTMGLGFSAGLDFAYNHTWSWEKSIEKTISLNSEHDYAVCYTTPFIVNVYEVVKTKSLDEEPQFVKFCEPQTPVFTALTVDEYNEAINRSTADFDNTKRDEIPPDQGTPLITKDMLSETTPGDPTGYVHTMKEACGLESVADRTETDAGFVPVNIVNTPNVLSQGSSLSFTDSDDNTGGISLSASVCMKFGFTANAFIFKGEASTTFGVNASIGGSVGRTNSDGVSFSTTYTMPNRFLPNRAEFVRDIESYNNDVYKKSEIRHYAPKDGYMYNYDSNTVCYKLKDFKVNRDMADEFGGNVNMNADNNVFALSYYTTNYYRTPEPPEQFTIQSMAKNADGSADITLLWNSATRNPDREVAGYNIYMSDINPDSSLIHLQNKDKLIAPSGSTYTTYKVHLENGDYNDNSVFYIAPAFATTNTGGLYIVTEGIISDTVSIASIEQNTKGNLVISDQPDIYYMQPDNTDETAVFSIDVWKNQIELTDPVVFYWQMHNEDSGLWETVSEVVVSSPTSVQDGKELFHSDFSIELPGADKASFVDKGVRCVAGIGNYSVSSDIVTMRFGEKKPDDPDPEKPDNPDPEKPDNPDPEKPDSPYDPVEKKFTIKNYDDLVLFRDKYNGEYETYQNVSIELSDNIIAPKDSVWSQGIGTEDKPFRGTFDGKGYCVIGLNIKDTEDGGLFGTICSSGKVKDMIVLGCTFSAGIRNAGGIAAVNEGTIDHCISGVNATGQTTVPLPSGLTVNPANYNSRINGTYSGGVVAVNHGTITGSRSSADVTGTNCGGIASLNDGTIYGCANNGTIGLSSPSCEQAGGLAGTNGGSIESSYNSGKIFCGNKNKKGFVAGVNNSTRVSNVFYSNVNGIPPIGADSDAALGTTCRLVDNTDMLTEDFVAQLNSVSDDTVTWLRTKYGSTFFNQGFPIVKGRNLTQRELSLTDNLSVRGMMHKSMKMTLTPLSADSSAYQALQQKGTVFSAYSVATTDANGQYVPSELWNAGGYQLLVPTNGKQVALVTQNDDGELVTITPDSVEDGMAVFTVASMSSFGLVETASENSNVQPSGQNITPDANTPVQTGDSFPGWVLFTVLAALCVAAAAYKKSHREQKDQ